MRGIVPFTNSRVLCMTGDGGACDGTTLSNGLFSGSASHRWGMILKLYPNSCFFTACLYLEAMLHELSTCLISGHIFLYRLENIDASCAHRGLIFRFAIAT